MSGIVEDFKQLFQQLNRDTCRDGLIESVYAPTMRFEDSFHLIEGRENFIRYCESLYENVSSIGFDYHQTFIDASDPLQGEAMITWTMCYSHPKLKWGKPIYVEGASHIKFNGKVSFHKDYFDGGELLYEHVPLLGRVIQTLKHRLN